MHRAAILPAVVLGLGFLDTAAHAQKGIFEDARVKAAGAATKFAQREFPSFKISDSALTQKSRCKMVGSYWIIKVSGNRLNPGAASYREKRIRSDAKFLEATVQVDSWGVVSIPEWSAPDPRVVVTQASR